VAGLLSVGFGVGVDGTVEGARTLCDTTRVPEPMERERRQLVQALLRAVRGLTFGKQRQASRVTLPFVFER
jgi:hypothetical protein